MTRYIVIGSDHNGEHFRQEFDNLERALRERDRRIFKASNFRRHFEVRDETGREFGWPDTCCVACASTGRVPDHEEDKRVWLKCDSCNGSGTPPTTPPFSSLEGKNGLENGLRIRTAVGSRGTRESEGG